MRSLGWLLGAFALLHTTAHPLAAQEQQPGSPHVVVLSSDAQLALGRAVAGELRSLGMAAQVRDRSAVGGDQLNPLAGSDVIGVVVCSERVVEVLTRVEDNIVIDRVVAESSILSTAVAVSELLRARRLELPVPQYDAAVTIQSASAGGGLVLTIGN